MKAKWHGQPFHDFKSNRWLITLECETPPEVYDSTRDEELNVEIKRYRKKRSLNANNYFYVLVNKIAEALGISDSEVHDRLLSDNISYIYNDENAIDWTVRDWKTNKYQLVKVDNEYWLDSGMEAVLAKPAGGYYMTGDSPKRSNIFWHIKGSHQMNTKEMSRLIDGAVNEAKELGIETLTPAELERMKQSWKAS